MSGILLAVKVNYWLRWDVMSKKYGDLFVYLFVMVYLAIMKDYITPQEVYKVSREGEVWRENGDIVSQRRTYLGGRSVWVGGRAVGLARVVLEAHGLPSPGPAFWAVHKDECRWNNHIDNLEWKDRGSVCLGSRQDEKKKWWHLGDEPALEDSRFHRVECNGREFGSVNAASRALKVHRCSISRALSTGREYKGMSFNYIK